MKESLLLFSLAIILISCKTENKATNNNGLFLSKAEMVEDYETFRSIFERANAGLYKYHSKPKVDSVFSANKQRIEGNMTYRDFYNILWNVVDYTGSCHNKLTYPDSLDKKLSNQKIFFPIPLKYIEGKLYANLDYKNIPYGSEIVSVNGIKSKEFSPLVAKYVSTDGFNKTGKYANIASDWLPSMWI